MVTVMTGIWWWWLRMMVVLFPGGDDGGGDMVLIDRWPPLLVTVVVGWWRLMVLLEDSRCWRWLTSLLLYSRSGIDIVEWLLLLIGDGDDIVVGDDRDHWCGIIGEDWRWNGIGGDEWPYSRLLGVIWCVDVVDDSIPTLLTVLLWRWWCCCWPDGIGWRCSRCWLCCWRWWRWFWWLVLFVTGVDGRCSVIVIWRWIDYLTVLLLKVLSRLVWYLIYIVPGWTLVISIRWRYGGWHLLVIRAILLVIPVLGWWPHNGDIVDEVLLLMCCLLLNIDPLPRILWCRCCSDCYVFVHLALR